MEWFIHHLLYFIPLGALLLDTLVGDPRSKYHPVVLLVIVFFSMNIYCIKRIQFQGIKYY